MEVLGRPSCSVNIARKGERPFGGRLDKFGFPLLSLISKAMFDHDKDWISSFLRNVENIARFPGGEESIESCQIPKKALKHKEMTPKIGP